MTNPELSGPPPEAPLTDWGEAIAAGTPTPGGGSAAAIAAALAAGLAAMVTRLTANKSSLSDAGHFHALAGEADELRAAALRLAEADWRAVSDVFKVLAQHQRTPEARGQRQVALQMAWARAAEVPLELVRIAARAALMCRQAAEGGHRNAWGDAAVGTLLAASAAQAAALMLELDLQGWSGGSAAEGMIAEARTLAAEATAEAVRVRGSAGGG